MSSPSKTIDPSAAGTSPSNARPSVDLPLPLSPTSPTTSPLRSFKSTPSTAFTTPVVRPSSRASASPPSAKRTDRSRMSTRLPVGAATSGFVGNADLLSLDLGRPARRDLRLGAVQPALDIAAGGRLDGNGVLIDADLH